MPPKRSRRAQLFEWRVIRVHTTPAHVLGYYNAVSAPAAIRAAIKEHQISDPLTQSRLAAQKVREIT
jgi:hypothetical protein